MKFVKQYWYLMVLIFALTVGYIFWSGRSIELEFKPYEIVQTPPEKDLLCVAYSLWQF